MIARRLRVLQPAERPRKRDADAEIETRDAQAAAQALGRKLLIVKSSPGSDLEVAFATLVEQGVGALAVSGDPFFEAHRDQLIALAARHMMPAIYVLREDPAAGGLMSYGTSISGAFRQGGVYVGSILKGTKPSDLPANQSTKFELVINLKTAKALSLDVPPTLLAVADEVIESGSANFCFGSIATELRCLLASVHPSISDIDVAVSRMSKWDQQATSNAWSEMKEASDRGRLHCCAEMQSN